MTLTQKERMRRAIRREAVDRLPTQVNYTRAMEEKLATHLGVSLTELPARLDNHLVRVDLTYPRRTSEDGRATYDWWGAGWSTETEGYWPADSPLAEAESLKDFPWPDPRDPHLMDEAIDIIACQGRRYFIAPNFGFCLFERAWSLRGFETFLTDLVLKPTFAEELLERVTQIQVILAQRFVALGVDGGYFGDDYGAQKRLLFSPRVWRNLFRPRLAAFMPRTASVLLALMTMSSRASVAMLDHTKPCAARGIGSHLAEANVRRSAGVLRWRIHPERATPRHARTGGVGCQILCADAGG